MFTIPHGGYGFSRARAFGVLGMWILQTVNWEPGGGGGGYGKMRGCAYEDSWKGGFLGQIRPL
jgi:hypothetical protein